MENNVTEKKVKKFVYNAGRYDLWIIAFVVAFGLIYVFMPDLLESELPVLLAIFGIPLFFIILLVKNLLNRGKPPVEKAPPKEYENKALNRGVQIYAYFAVAAGAAFLLWGIIEFSRL